VPPCEIFSRLVLAVRKGAEAVPLDAAQPQVCGGDNNRAGDVVPRRLQREDVPAGKNQCPGLFATEKLQQPAGEKALPGLVDQYIAAATAIKQLLQNNAAGESCRCQYRAAGRGIGYN